MNNKERVEWVNNDENLYIWKRQSNCSMTQFVKNNKEKIDVYTTHQQHKYNGNGGSNCTVTCPFYKDWRK